MCCGRARHVGLPLSILLADAGEKVMIYDLYEKSIDLVSPGKMPFQEDGADGSNNLFSGRTVSQIRLRYRGGYF